MLSARLNISDLVKFSLIDLETLKSATRGKRKQPERLSEKTRKGCDSLNTGITKEASEPKLEEASRPQRKLE